MEMKVKNDKFCLLDATDEKWIHDSEDGAIEALKALVSKRKELNPEDVSILEVNTAGEKWEMHVCRWRLLED